MSKPTAIVLASGGLDSTTCIGFAIEGGFDVVPVSFRYGQRHSVELDAVQRVVRHYGIEKHFVFDLGLFKQIGKSALTDDIAVPIGRSVNEMAGGIPVTYVPARNLVFLAHAVGVAETHGSSDIYIGVNAVDYSGYPDCRPEFIEAFEKTANLATKAGVEGDMTLNIHAPLAGLTKAEIIREGIRMGVPYELTHSCYSPTTEGVSCGQCDSCLLRLKGFAEAGSEDPIRYAEVA